MYLFDIIFDSLPDYIKNDVVFGTIKETLQEYLKTYKVDFNSILTNVRVCETILKEIDFAYLETIMPKANISASSDEGDICHAFLYSREYIFTISIKGTETAYKVILGITENVKPNSSEPITKVEYKYSKHDNIGIIEERKSLTKGNYYHDYKYEAKYFKDGVEVATANDKQKDEEFISRFSVPNYLARTYRTNFKKYADEINKCANLSLTKYIDDMKELDWVMQRYDDYNHFIEYLKGQAYNQEKYDEIVNLFNQIKSFLPESFAISANTLDAISFYLFNIYNALSTRGVIAVKNRNSYELYYIVISENNLVISPTNVSSEKAKEMLESSIYDAYSDGDIDDLMTI